MSKQPVKIAVTGAAGQISYSLLFRLASGAFLGPDQPIKLSLLEIPAAMPALQGTILELQDCAFELLHQIEAHDNAAEAFKDIDYAFLVGARPRTADMQRSDLLAANGKIFAEQGRALRYAKAECKIIVVGNPANTNARILANNAPEFNPRNISAMTRLDHNRAVAQIAEQRNCLNSQIQRVIIWGNHSATQYPDISHSLIDGQPGPELIESSWYKDHMIARVQQRGTEIIKARGLSSAASAANAAIDHMRDWACGSRAGDYVSMAVYSGGEYGISKGLYYSFPCKCSGGEYHIVEDLHCSDFSWEKMRASEQELIEERKVVDEL